MRGFVRFLVWAAIFLGAIGGVLRATILDVWTVPDDAGPFFTASLAPNLEPGDLVVLMKVSPPGYTDLVRCAHPEGNGRWVVGRVMGKQGDKIVTDGMTTSINDRPTIITHGCDAVTITAPDTQNAVKLSCSYESYAGFEYQIARYGAQDVRNAAVTSQVQDMGLYLLSDDRYFHEDSRDWNAPVTVDACPYKVIFRIMGGKGWGDSDKRLTIIR